MLKKVISSGVIPEFLLPTKFRRFITPKYFRVKMLESKLGYFYIDPMPTEQELDSYYSERYWSTRSGKSNLINNRDLEHFLLLEPYIKNEANFSFLNFGAGHGGISHLVKLAKPLSNVINIEPSVMSFKHDSNWSVYSSIESVREKVDIIYGSHSLEHVNNLEKYQELFRSLLKPEGLVFWEVPNAFFPGNGGSDGKLHVPHTYYFTRLYFDNVYSKVIMNGCWDDRTFPSTLVDDEPEGGVIRFLGRF
jgi:hypothetical protein